VHLPVKGISEYSDFNFSSATIFNDLPIAVGVDGLYLCEECDKSLAEEEVVGVIKTGLLVMPDLQSSRVRCLLLNGEFDGNITVTAIANEDTEREYTFVPKKTTKKQQNGKVYISWNERATHWQLQFENEPGEDFSFDSIDMRVVGLKRAYGD